MHSQTLHSAVVRLFTTPEKSLSLVPPQLQTKILLVEDSRLDAHLTTRALQQIPGWPVLIDLVDDGDKALQFLARERLPDLVILDLNLPKRDGIEVLQLIRGSEALRSLLVFIFSSCPADIAEERMLSAQVVPDHYFEKPHEMSTFASIAARMKERYLTLCRQRSSAMAG